MANRSRAGRTSRRPIAARRLATRLLIVCGGERTEKRYFEGLRRAEHNPAVKIKLKTHPKSPTEVVRYARTIRRNDPDDFDEVWCVLDVDEFQNIDQAADLARRSGIKVAVSNPCFELWLLLHLCDHTAHISTRDVQRLLSKHVPGYDKSELSYDDFAIGLGAACGRAQELDQTGAAHHVNPSTNVWQLALKIQRPTGGDP